MRATKRLTETTSFSVRAEEARLRAVSKGTRGYTGRRDDEGRAR